MTGHGEIGFMSKLNDTLSFFPYRVFSVTLLMHNDTMSSVSALLGSVTFRYFVLLMRCVHFAV